MTWMCAFACGTHQLLCLLAEGNRLKQSSQFCANRTKPAHIQVISFCFSEKPGTKEQSFGLHQKIPAESRFCCRAGFGKTD